MATLAKPRSRDSFKTDMERDTGHRDLKLPSLTKRVARDAHKRSMRILALILAGETMAGESEDEQVLITLHLYGALRLVCYCPKYFRREIEHAKQTEFFHGASSRALVVWVRDDLNALMDESDEDAKMLIRKHLLNLCLELHKRQVAGELVFCEPQARRPATTSPVAG